MTNFTSRMHAADRHEQIRYICRRGGPKDRKEWTPHELELVKLHFPNRKKLEQLLPERTWIAIRSRAGLLGLRKKLRRWLASDLSKLKKMWSAGESREALEAALPNYTWDQIRFQARSQRFHRPVKSFAPSGHPIIDQIKQRARELNMSMRDVDALAGSGQYFLSANWIKKPRPHARYVAKAVAALDGDLTAVWR